MVKARFNYKRLEITFDGTTDALCFHDGAGAFLYGPIEKPIENDRELEEFILTDEFEEIFIDSYCTNLDLLDDIRRNIEEKHKR